MMDLLRFRLLGFAFILMFSIQSCAEIKDLVSLTSPAETSTHAGHTQQTSSEATVQHGGLAEKYMEAGEYQKAIDIYSDQYRKQRDDLSLMKVYAKSLNAIKSIADRRLYSEEVVSASRLYNVLLNNYTKINGFEHMLSFNDTDLNKKLTYCKKTLSRQGFEEYREGNLNKAIVLWQGLLAIDPDNTDIKGAVRTATQQEKNLQEKD